MTERTTRQGKKAEKTEERTTKRERVPYAANVSRLSIPQSILAQYPGRPMHCFRWVNNEEGEVSRRLDAHWEVCKGEGVTGVYDPNATAQMGEVISRPVGRGKTTNDLKAVLMTCTPEIFKEDQELQDRANMAFQNSLKKSKADAGQVDPDGGYAPNLDDGSVGFSRKTSSK
jgi:hypothetical protein